jgi:putative transcriptional regulator
VDVKAIRTRLNLSQDAFAHRFGFSVAAVRDWEQHRRQPEKAARILLLVIANDPEAVNRALSKAAA